MGWGGGGGGGTGKIKKGVGIMVHGQVLKEGGRAGTFYFSFFQGLLFLHL